MPIFDLYCATCGKTLNDAYIKSDKLPTCCTIPMSKKPSRMLSGFPKGGITLTNVGSDPIHFDSKKELRAFKSKHDLDLGALPND